MKKLLIQIRACKKCGRYLGSGANPIVAATSKSRIIIIGQAPGRIAHNTAIPWNDKSGDTLRSWLAVDKPIFYNPDLFALMSMGFCYPGAGPSGDLPPRPGCARLWHSHLLRLMPEARLILLIGQHAQEYYLGERAQATLTDTVRQYKEYLPAYWPLPHPSPRNNIWQARNKWFESDVLPGLKKKVTGIIKA